MVSIGKLVHRQVIGVVPQGELGIITHPVWERRIHLQGVEPPAAADGVASLGHTNALVKGASARERGKGEVGYYPAVSNLIIKNKRIPMVQVPPFWLLPQGVLPPSGAKNELNVVPFAPLSGLPDLSKILIEVLTTLT